MNQEQIADQYANKWFVLLAVSTAIFLAGIDTSIVNISLPTLEKTLDTSFAWVQWVVMSYVLTITGLVLIFGRLGDMIGKKRLYVSGVIIFTVGSALCGLAPNVQWLVAFRVVQAIGGALLQALGIAILTEAFPASERGKVLGIAGTVISLGIAFGPSIGGLLIDLLGWRSIFLVNVPVGIAATFMTTRFVPNLLPKGGQSFDFFGALMLTITLLAFSMGMTISQEEGFNNAWVVGLLLVTVLGLVVFIKVEQRVAAPMIKLSLFRNILFSINLFTAVCAFIVLSSNILHPFYLEIVAGYSVREVGLIIGTFPIMLAVLAPTAGTFSDRFGTRPITVLGLSLTLIACLGLSTLDEDSSLISFIAWLMLLGGGIGVFQSPNNSAVMGAVPPDQLGVASGLLATSRNIGQMIGLPLLGTVFAARVFDLAGNTNDVGDAPPFAIVGGIHVVFLLSAFIILVALLTALGGVWLERRQA